MNFKKLLFAFIASSGLLSCDNGNDVKQNLNPLIGTWVFISETYTECSDPANNHTTDYEPCTPTDCYKITFKSSGLYIVEFIIDGMTTSDGGQYSILGSQLTLDDDETRSFSINGDMLIITGEDLGCQTILTLTKG